MIIYDGSTTADADDSKAARELFNKYFYSVFTRTEFPMRNPDDQPLPAENSLNSISLTV